MKKVAAKCYCGARMIPVVYGLPSEALFEKAERGEVYLGGCVLFSDSPKWYCPVCERRCHGTEH